MTSQYSRKNKTKDSNKAVPTEHIKTGLTALQKTVALVGSILSIIVATITITRALHPENGSKKEDSNTKTSSTIVKIIEKDTSSNTNNDTTKASENSSYNPDPSSKTSQSSEIVNPSTSPSDQNVIPSTSQNTNPDSSLPNP
ncbi:hypothetical protein N1496_01500 [Streptococcus didelphis]|uniref:TBC1 domain family member 8B n=1 Tax=Streptococcus didelphis TaxID=102886 RepID=A0ABY9LHS3_9STRE|nr:DUF6556 family protein [Streptococcus didelphis]WMB28345.1 hypothetical protein N1496_01500 [Streptococcus didelphis]